MERFRDSVMDGLRLRPRNSGFAPNTAPPPRGEGQDRSMGELIAEKCKLGAAQVDKILAYQREKGGRFGQAAIALGFASTDDVLHALAQQFDYPYASAEQRKALPELVALNEPFSAQAEAIRGIRSWATQRVFGEDTTKLRRALAVVSANAGDGKSYVAANLAVTLAQLGGRTLLMDADLRGPRLHRMFGLAGDTGLSSILSGRTEKRVVQKVNGINNLFLLPVGIIPPNPLELVERPAYGLLLRELTHKFDHVIVDTSAAEYGTDAAVIAARCGAALVVARKHRSRVGALQELTEMLGTTPASVAGVIVNEY